MGERLKAEEQLEGANENGRGVPGHQKDREGKEFSRERRPEEAADFEALAGEESGSLHGFREERAQALCHSGPVARSGPISLSTKELSPLGRPIARSPGACRIGTLPDEAEFPCERSSTAPGAYTEIGTEMRSGILSHIPRKTPAGASPAQVLFPVEGAATDPEESGGAALVPARELQDPLYVQLF